MNIRDELEGLVKEWTELDRVFSSPRPESKVEKFSRGVAYGYASAAFDLTELLSRHCRACDGGKHVPVGDGSGYSRCEECR